MRMGRVTFSAITTRPTLLLCCRAERQAGRRAGRRRAAAAAAGGLSCCCGLGSGINAMHRRSCTDARPTETPAHLHELHTDVPRALVVPLSPVVQQVDFDALLCC